MEASSAQAAQALERDLKWAEAAEQYALLLEETPTVALYEKTAWCFSRATQYQKAIEYLLKLNELEPHSAKCLYMIGYQYYCQKKWIDSIEWFEKALEQYPDYFVVKYRLSYAYIQIAGAYMKLTKAEYWKAIGHLRDCHKLWSSFDEAKKKIELSTYFDVNFLHGKVLMDLPRHQPEAINLFLVALSIKPNDEYAQYNLAKTYYLSGDFQKAHDSIPTGGQYYIIELSAYTEAKLGNYPKAISIVEKLMQRRKRDYLYVFLAEVHLLAGEPDKAYIAADKAIGIGARNHKCFYTAAKIYYHFGLYDKAITYLERAMEMKKTRYKTSFVECEVLRDKINSEKPPNHQDDSELITKLDHLVTPTLETSTICRYNADKGFGFIKGGARDIFFHVSSCRYKDIAIGDRVQFSTITTERGISATDVQKVR